MKPDEPTLACCRRAESAYAELFGDDLVALALMGSSVIGEKTGGWSDLDLAVFVTARAFDRDGGLSLTLAVGAQQLVKSIDVLSAGYAFFSPTFLNPDRPTTNWVGLLPGTYETLRGILPAGSEADPQACRAFASAYLSRSGQIYERETLRFAGLHDFGVSGKDIVTWLRSIRNDVKYLMLSAIAVSTDDYSGVWSMGKNRAVEVFQKTCAPDVDLDRFYAILARHSPSQQNVPMMKEACLHALRFIRSCTYLASDLNVSG